MTAGLGDKTIDPTTAEPSRKRAAGFTIGGAECKICPELVEDAGEVHRYAAAAAKSPRPSALDALSGGMQSFDCHCIESRVSTGSRAMVLCIHHPI